MATTDDDVKKCPLNFNDILVVGIDGIGGGGLFFLQALNANTHPINTNNTHFRRFITQ